MTHSKSRGAMPPSLRELWERDLADCSRDEVEAKFARCELAAAEQNFSGFLRRAIRDARRPLTPLASEAAIDPQRIAAFLEGRGTLESAEIDRLCSSIGIVPIAASHP